MAESTIFGGSTGLLQAGGGRRAALRDILLQEATSTAPVRHWLQGANRVAQGLLGGAMEREARERAAADSQALLGAMGGGTAAGAPTAATARPDTLTGSDGSAAPAQTNGSTAGDVAFFNSRGWTPVQSAALASTIVNESSGNTSARNPGDGRDGSDSIGTMQWNGPRSVALQQFAAQRGRDWRDRRTQLEFVDAELRGQVAGSNESRWGNMLARANDPVSAARAAVSYVRPAGWSAANPEGAHTFGRRLATTRSIYGQYGGAPAAPVTPGPQAAVPEDTLGGGDGSETLNQPMPNLPPAGGPDLQAAQMPNIVPPGAPRAVGTDPMASVAPLTQAEDDAAWAERQRLAAVEDERQRGLPWPAAPAPMRAPMPQGRPGILDATRTVGAGDMMDMAQANPTMAPTAPTEAPVPMARPQMSVPMPMARPAAPNALPPGAVPAGPAPGPRLDISRALGISDRDRLMMLRDEGSLAPGEADRLRGAPVEMMGRTQGGAPAATGTAPAAAPAGPSANGFLAPVNSVRDRLYEMLTGRSAPAAASQQMQASGAAPASIDARRAALMRLATSEDTSPQIRAMAMQGLQQMQPSLKFMARPDGSVLAIDERTGNVRVVATGTQAPVAHEVVKDGAGNIIGFVNPVTRQVFDANNRPVNGPQQSASQAAAGTSATAPPSISAPAPSAAAPSQVGPSGLPIIRGARPMTAAERTEWGVDPGDSRVWMMGSDGKPTTVGGDQRGESAHQQVVGKALGEQQVTLVNGEQQALATISNLNAMERLVNDPRFYSGPGVDLRNQATKIMEGFGIASPGASSPNAVFEGLSRQDILQKLGGSLGPGVSNADLAYVQGIGANTGDAQQSIRDKIAAFRKLAERQAEIGRMAREYAAANNGKIDATFLGQLAQFARDNPVFARSESTSQPGQAPQTSPRRIGSQVEYDALPPGTVYIAPDGSQRTKR